MGPLLPLGGGQGGDAVNFLNSKGLCCGQSPLLVPPRTMEKHLAINFYIIILNTAIKSPLILLNYPGRDFRVMYGGFYGWSWAA